MTVFARDMSMTVMVPEQRSTCRPVAPRPEALLRHEMGRRPSSLFSLFFPKLSAADPPFPAEILDFWTTTCRTNSGVLRCFPLLLMFIRDRWCFNGFRKRYRARAPAWARAGAPALAENLQVLTMLLRFSRRVFNIVVLLSVIPLSIIPRTAANHA
jgi:hypothetical protein